MENLIYRLEDGRLWDTRNACWLAENPVALLSDEEQPAGDQAAHAIPIRDLVSADGVSDEAYLVKTLEFYGYPLGTLADSSRRVILEQLEKLDTAYLTPRTLAGLATNDPVAESKWQEHEEKAQPLRERLADLEEG